MYELGDYRYQWFDAHRDRLMDEAARERLARTLPRRPSWQCRACLRLGAWLIEMGERLQARARRQMQSQAAGLWGAV